jgi:hypothetical protein
MRFMEPISPDVDGIEVWSFDRGAREWRFPSFVTRESTIGDECRNVNFRGRFLMAWEPG